MTADPAATYERLKIETAAMFGFDVSNLTLTQGLQLDLVSLLRLEVDTMRGAVLAGETVDLQRLVAAHGLLQKMLPAQALVAPAAAADRNDLFAGAKEELRQLLSQRAKALELRDRRRESELAANPDKARAEFEANLQRAIENSKHQDALKSEEIFSDPAGSDVSVSGVPQPLPSPVAAGGCEPPVLIEPAPPAPPQAKSEAELIAQMERVNSTPALPPAREPEEWRKFIGPDGEIRTSPLGRLGDGATIFEHACALGCEGIVSKRLGSAYRSGRVNHWLEIKNSKAPAVRREAEEDWGTKPTRRPKGLV